jgi:hypothetical protein
MVFATSMAPLMGVDGLVFNNGLGGGSSFSSKAHIPKPASWKKRACAQSSGNIGQHTPVQRQRGKCALTKVVESTATDAGEPRMEKARNNGGVVIHESELVEAVEQPCRSQ